MSVLDAVRAAVADVDDPELPGVSIVDLGIVERIDVDEHGRAAVLLVPTHSGCPALEAIRRDVADAVRSVDGVASVAVSFAATPVWSPEWISASGRLRLAGALGVAVDTGTGAACPRCGGPTEVVSEFGPTRCRRVDRCTACGEVVEVVR